MTKSEMSALWRALDDADLDAIGKKMVRTQRERLEEEKLQWKRARREAGSGSCIRRKKLKDYLE